MSVDVIKFNYPLCCYKLYSSYCNYNSDSSERRRRYANYFQVHGTGITDSQSSETRPQNNTHTSAIERGEGVCVLLYTRSLIIVLDSSHGRVACREEWSSWQDAREYSSSCRITANVLQFPLLPWELRTNWSLSHGSFLRDFTVPTPMEKTSLERHQKLSGLYWYWWTVFLVWQ